MSPKYRHRGYMDSDDDSSDRRKQQQPRRNELTAEERIQRRSMRKATDPQARELLRCHVCGRDYPDYSAITYDSECRHCQAALRCCRTCRHFNVDARWQCTTETDKPKPNKTSKSDCEQYEPLLVLDSTGRRGDGDPKSSGSAKDLFDNLFKN